MTPPAAFIVSPQYEVCYALAALAESAPVHATWCRGATARLRPALRRALEAQSSLLWYAVTDITGAAAPAAALDGFLAALRGAEPAVFQRRVMTGILHDENVVERLATGRLSTGAALAALPEAKREWLAYVGLFPYAPETPAGALIEALTLAPEEVQDQTADLAEAFVEDAFAAAWTQLAPQLARSRDRAERLFASATLAEFATAMRLLVEVDEANGALRALRGGAHERLADLERLYFMPSAFNHRRFWSVPGDGATRVAVFPFFDHTLELALPRRAPATPLPAAVDPALMCKALGDATRFSMLTLMAAQPRTAADLAREMALTTPTISHHVFQLRAAGLVVEHRRGKAVELSVDRAALEGLSGLLVARLFGADGAAAERRQ